MKTPLFFKLLLLLALGFRLIKAARKPKQVIPPVLSLKKGPMESWGLIPSGDLSALEQVVWLYRQSVRPLPWEDMTPAQQGVSLLYAWSRQRESSFRWLWYRPEYALAWGELLRQINYQEAADQWLGVLQEISGQENPTNPRDWIPNGDTSYPALETFQHLIRSECIYSKFITYVFFA